MPTYEYACKSCGEHVEVVQSFTDAPLTECTACGGPLRKVFGNIGVVLKGSGFYKTDSRTASSGSKKNGDKSESKSDSSSASESKSSDTKSKSSDSKSSSSEAKTAS